MICICSLNPFEFSLSPLFYFLLPCLCFLSFTDSCFLCVLYLLFFPIIIFHAYPLFHLSAFFISNPPFPSLLCSCLAFLCPLSTLHPPSLPCPTAKGGVIKSLEDMGAVVTNLALGTTRCLVPMGPRASPKKKASNTEKEDTLVMDTKLKIIEILEVRECRCLLLCSLLPLKYLM